MKFTFRSHQGNADAGLATVEASTEEDARVEAMKKIWGDTYHNGYPYVGKGLLLVGVE